jgi:hypothetical protein
MEDPPLSGQKRKASSGSGDGEATMEVDDDGGGDGGGGRFFSFGDRAVDVCPPVWEVSCILKLSSLSLVPAWSGTVLR